MTDTAEIYAIKDDAQRAEAIVNAFLVASMIPDPDGAAKFIADDVDIHFTGNTPMQHPREMTAYNKARYNWVKKDIERCDVGARRWGNHRLQYRYALRGMAEWR